MLVLSKSFPPFLMLATTLLVASSGYAQTLSPGENKSSTARSDRQLLEEINWLEKPIFPDIQTWEIIAQDELIPTDSRLVVTPRFGGEFTRGPGVGYQSSFGSIFGFVPLIQTPGENLFFLDAQLNLSTLTVEGQIPKSKQLLFPTIP